MTITWDILGTGSACVDDFLLVDHFPAPDTKQEVLAIDRQGGGLVPTALVAASRLGMRCALVDMFGEDDLSRWMEDDFQREGIDLSPAHHRVDVRAIHSVVIVDQAQQSRTILYTMAGRQQALHDFLPDEVVRRARVFMIDDINQANIDSIYRAAQVAHEAGIPVVADFDKTPHAGLLHIVTHLILSSVYAEHITGAADPAQSAMKLWHDGRAAVIVTDGAAGSWYVTGKHDPVHQPAFPVNTIDTTGCGDVYHGAYAAALIWGWSIEQRVRLATACAALKSTQIGGRRGIPTRAQLETFLQTTG